MDTKLKAQIEDQLEQMRQQDEQKLAQYRLNMQEGLKLTHELRRAGVLTEETE